jgi:eukaryotic-like serine/threonine-protein kinase
MLKRSRSEGVVGTVPESLLQKGAPAGVSVLPERFSLVRKLGSGGMGAVYEVFDRERGERVALKTLIERDPAHVRRLKSEFRSLCGVSHPNLVQLYELICTEHLTFLTMQLIEGERFLDHVRTPDPALAAAREMVTNRDERQPVLPGISPADGRLQDRGVQAASMQRAPAQGVQIARLRAALGHLARGLAALHAAGKLHRDIKPSNMLIARDGRLVLLDFGLVTNPSKDWLERSSLFRSAGTPAYMSPEQFAAELLTTASDWYSVGLLLYEALTGRVPHFEEARHLVHLAHLRSQVAPIPPRVLNPELPADLEQLCLALLRREPSERWTAAQVLATLDGAAPELSSPPPEPQFFGREPEVETLLDAFATSVAGHSVVQLVHGSSGIGKTALLDHFIERVLCSQRTLVLRGRCYERESIPYKALDSLVDQLCSYCSRLPKAEAAELAALDLPALAQLFPAFESVLASVHDAARISKSLERRYVRSRAVAALRGLLRRIGDRYPLVLCIDDLQWGDVDSARLLREIMDDDEAPTWLVLLTYRTEDRATCALLDLLQEPSSHITLREFELGPLPPTAARDLARCILKGNHETLAERVARESGGSPFIVAQLTHYVVEQHRAAALRPLSAERVREELDLRLEAALRAHREQLDGDARRLLEVVALASVPLHEAMAMRAAGIAEGGQAAVYRLVNARLLRHAVGSDSRIEIYHDRIREGIVASLGDDLQRQLHDRLAEALRAADDPDLEAIAFHCRAAGKAELAREYACSAAREAAQSLAFDRTARLCRVALELLPPDDPNLHSIRVSLAEALQNAGRSPESAHVYLAAADRAPPAEASQLRQRAGEQLLLSGHVDDALSTIEHVLAHHGIRLPHTRRSALLGLLSTRLHLVLSGWVGTGLRAGLAQREDTAGLWTRIDVCWGVGLYMSAIDPVRGAYFQARNLLLSLRSREPFRVARALSVEASYRSIAGKPSLPRVMPLLARARALCQSMDSPYLLGLVGMSEAVVAFMAEERWTKCGELCERSVQIFREHCRGVAWEISNGQFFALNSLLLRGELAAVAENLPSALASAKENGNVFAESFLGFRFSPMVRLARDDLDSHQEEFGRLSQRISEREFYLQHYWERCAVTQRLLYLDAGPAALDTVEGFWPLLQQSLLMRMQFHRIDALHLRARCRLAVASGVSPSARAEHLRAADRDAVGLDRENTLRSRGLAASLRAGVASLSGDCDATVLQLHAAADHLSAVGMELHASAARLAHGALIGGSIGLQQKSAALAALSKRGVCAPERMTQMLLPGVLGGARR